MILGIVCTIAVTLVALWQTWSLRCAERVITQLLIDEMKRKLLLVEMAEVIGTLHRAAIAGDGTTMLAVLKAASARYGAAP